MHEEQWEIREYLSDMRSSLVRIEERLSNFINKVEEHEEEIEDVKKHVHTVRVISRVFSFVMAGLVALAAIWQGIKA